MLPKECDSRGRAKWEVSGGGTDAAVKFKLCV